MTYSEIAHIFKLPVKAIVALHKDGLITIPPSSDSVRVLHLITNIWGKDRYIKMQLAGYTKQKRRRLADTAEMTKPQSYAYNRMLYNRVARHNDDFIRQLSIKEIADEINYNYKVPITGELLNMIKRMRWQVYKVDVTDPAYIDNFGRKVRRSDLL